MKNALSTPPTRARYRSNHGGTWAPGQDWTSSHKVETTLRALVLLTGPGPQPGHPAAALLAASCPEIPYPPASPGPGLRPMDSTTSPRGQRSFWLPQLGESLLGTLASLHWWPLSKPPQAPLAGASVQPVSGEEAGDGGVDAAVEGGMGATKSLLRGKGPWEGLGSSGQMHLCAWGRGRGGDTPVIGSGSLLLATQNSAYQGRASRGQTSPLSEGGVSVGLHASCR